MTQWQSALQQVLESWRGTPWVGGQQCKGPRGGVDCVRFVVGVLDELHGYDLPPIPRLPQDMSLHDRAGAYRVAREIEKRYPHAIIDGGGLEPGDILIVQTGTQSGEGHVLIVDPNCVSLWHASNGVGVVRTSIGVIKTFIRQYRPTEREKWHS